MESNEISRKVNDVLAYVFNDGQHEMDCTEMGTTDYMRIVNGLKNAGCSVTFIDGSMEKVLVTRD